MEKQIKVVTIDNATYNRIQREKEQRRIQNLKTRTNNRKILRNVLIGIGFVGAIHGAVWASHEYSVNKAAGEALSDADLNMLDNGRQADSHMTREELAAYVDEHNITLEELSEAVGVKLKWDSLYSEDNMEKIERLNSEAFEEATKNSKGM